MNAPKLPALYTDIDLMRDVYMTRAQREAYERILARAAVEASQPKAEAVAWRDRDEDAEEWNYTDNPMWAEKYGPRYQPLYTHPHPSAAVTELDAMSQGGKP